MSPRPTGPERVQENRVRRVASRRGYRAEKSKVRDPKAIGYGTWQLIDVATGEVVATGSADDIEEYLNR